MTRATNDDGTLTYAFSEIVEFNYPYYLVRLLGGLLVIAGMGLMCVNTVRTFRMARGQVDAPVIPPAAESHA